MSIEKQDKGEFDKIQMGFLAALLKGKEKEISATAKSKSETKKEFLKQV